MSQRKAGRGSDLAEYVPVLNDDIITARRQDLGTILTRSALKFPDKIAIIDGDVRTTYREFDAEVNRCAHGLVAQGIEPGERVAILSHNCYEFIVAYLALARITAISVPINFNLTGTDVAYIIDDSRPAAVITEAALIPTMEDALEESTHDVEHRFAFGRAPHGWVPFATLTEHAEESPIALPIGDDDPVQILYTSGTTSRPKGAIMTNRNLIAQYVSDIVDGEYHRDDIELHALPLYHCAALHDFLTPDIYVGATSVILAKPTPDNILRLVAQEKITKMFCPPTVWISLLRSEQLATADVSSLQKGYYGAATMPVAVLQELAERIPSLRLFNYYGQTELAPNATVLFPDEQIDHAGSAGRASLNVLTRLHDDEDRPVPPGQVGEIVHRTPHLMRGYWRNQEATDEAFKGGWFHSGDLAVMDEDGYLTIVDRKKDLIISGGENVASREIEEALHRHPAVAEAAVFGVPHPYWIEAVTAAVVLKPGESVTPDELVEFAGADLAGFKQPKRILVIDSLPRNPSGKILKRQLRADYASLFEGAGQ